MTQSNQNLIKKPALLRTAVFEQKIVRFWTNICTSAEGKI